MGGEIRIERIVGTVDITIDEWRTAIRSTPGIRPNEQALTARNPQTGSAVNIPPNPDIAEVFDGEHWYPLISWDEGSAFFYPPQDDDSFDTVAMEAVFRSPRP